MARIETGFGTDYRHQSFEDMIEDLQTWIETLQGSQEQYHSKTQQLKETGYWDTLVLILRDHFVYSMKFCDTSIKEITEVLTEIQYEVRPDHITRLQSLSKTAQDLENRHGYVWNHDFVTACLSWDYNNDPDFSITVEIHSIGRRMTFDLHDLYGLASRLNDFVGRRGQATQGELISNGSIDKSAAQPTVPLPTEDGADEKPWEKIPDLGWDRQALKLWRKGYTASEIADRIPGIVSKTVYNRVSKLRRTYGTDIVPTNEQRKKMYRRRLKEM